MWAPGSPAFSAIQTLAENADASFLPAELAANIGKGVREYASPGANQKLMGMFSFHDWPQSVSSISSWNWTVIRV